MKSGAVLPPETRNRSAGLIIDQSKTTFPLTGKFEGKLKPCHGRFKMSYWGRTGHSERTLHDFFAMGLRSRFTDFHLGLPAVGLACAAVAGLAWLAVRDPRIAFCPPNRPRSGLSFRQRPVAECVPKPKSMLSSERISN